MTPDGAEGVLGDRKGEGVEGLPEACADAMLNAAVKDLGAGTDAAGPFRAALTALRGGDSV